MLSGLAHVAVFSWGFPLGVDAAEGLCHPGPFLSGSMVLKYRFYYYSSIGRPTDQEMIAIGKTVCYTHKPWRRRHARPRRANGEAPGSRQEAEEVKGKRGQEPSLWFPWEGRGGAGQAELGLARSSDFSRLWGTGAVPRSLAYFGQVDREPEHESPIKEILGMRALDWFMYEKRVLGNVAYYL